MRATELVSSHRQRNYRIGKDALETLRSVQEEGMTDVNRTSRHRRESEYRDTHEPVPKLMRISETSYRVSGWEAWVMEGDLWEEQ
jgi:hypothetical protein